MIDFDQAFAIVSAAATPLGSEDVPLWQARNRFLAEPVVARVDAPRADVSAMDGYAVRGVVEGQLALIGVAFPGAPFTGTLEPGECVRIFTGAAVPRGADRVIVQEIVRVAKTGISVEGETSGKRHIRHRASDFARGDVLLEAGRRLDARALVAAAGADLAAVTVWRAPRVAVLGTGDELAAPGEARSTPGAIPESVALGVAALAEDHGGECRVRRRVRDDPGAMSDAARQALDEADIVVITGGASVGEKDFAKPVFVGLGIELGFSQVAIKPGKPVWFGRIGGKRVLGLPGNPTSALIAARLLLAPLVVGMAGGDPASAVRWRAVRSASAIPPCGTRETFICGRWRGDAAEPLPNQDSAAQWSLADTDLLIRRPAGAPAVEAGAEVHVLKF